MVAVVVVGLRISIIYTCILVVAFYVRIYIEAIYVNVLYLMMWSDRSHYFWYLCCHKFTTTTAAGVIISFVAAFIPI